MDLQVHCHLDTLLHQHLWLKHLQISWGLVRGPLAGENDWLKDVVRHFPKWSDNASHWYVGYDHTEFERSDYTMEMCRPDDEGCGCYLPCQRRYRKECGSPRKTRVEIKSMTVLSLSSGTEKSICPTAHQQPPSLVSRYLRWTPVAPRPMFPRSWKGTLARSYNKSVRQNYSRKQWRRHGKKRPKRQKKAGSIENSGHRGQADATRPEQSVPSPWSWYAHKLTETFPTVCRFDSLQVSHTTSRFLPQCQHPISQHLWQMLS